MKILKQLLVYLVWIIISLLGGIGYMRMVLGPKPEPSNGIMRIFDWVYGAALFEVGSMIGGIIALLFILLDIFYLKKKLKNNRNSILIRLLSIIIIIVLVGTTHFILEKVIDVI